MSPGAMWIRVKLRTRTATSRANPLPVRRKSIAAIFIPWIPQVPAQRLRCARNPPSMLSDSLSSQTARFDIARTGHPECRSRGTDGSRWPGMRHAHHDSGVRGTDEKWPLLLSFTSAGSGIHMSTRVRPCLPGTPYLSSPPSRQTAYVVRLHLSIEAFDSPVRRCRLGGFSTPRRRCNYSRDIHVANSGSIYSFSNP